MMTSPRAAMASSYLISGSGLAIAKTIGLSAIDFTISRVTMSADETPQKTSAPRMASASDRAFGVGGEELLVGVHPLRPAAVDDAHRVHHQDVVVADAEALVEPGAGDPRRAGAAEDHLHVADLLPDELEGVDQGGAADDGRAVLVVVEDRDVHRFLERFLDLEALRGLDVLEVDPAEGRLEHLDRPDDLLRVERIELDVEHVDVGEPLEEEALPLHHRFPGDRADVAEAEHGGAVADHRHQVPLRRVEVCVLGVGRDPLARFGDARGVRQREVALRRAGFRRGDLDFTRPARRVIVKSFLCPYHSHAISFSSAVMYLCSYANRSSSSLNEGCAIPMRARTRSRMVLPYRSATPYSVTT